MHCKCGKMLTYGNTKSYKIDDCFKWVSYVEKCKNLKVNLLCDDCRLKRKGRKQWGKTERRY